MRNSLKVAKWEIKRNMSNKSFVISLIITPIIFMIFFFVPSLFDKSDVEDGVQILVKDELNLFDQLQEIASIHDFQHWQLEKTDIEESEMQKHVENEAQTVYMALTEKGLDEGKINIYMSDDIDRMFIFEMSALEEALRKLQIERLGLTENQKEVIARGVVLEPVAAADIAEAEGTVDNSDEATDPIKRAVPGIFAGVILFSIVMTGMMIFTSASQEKKEKVAEIILSSLTPTELMQGKIIGYFVLGITQVAVWIVFLIPLVMWKTDFPVLEYLFVPQLALLLILALAGYLLFAAIFVAIGATVEDMTSTSNFQGMVMMLPFLPALFIGPIISDPSGLIAKIGSFIPFTSPAILIFRLSMLEEWPWIEIIIALAILVISIWIVMKLAGKIFKVGILMYGKNATPKEIWKWIWA